MDLWLTSIDPYSPLPSFFEMFMCTSISKTFHSTTLAYLKRALSTAQERGPTLLEPLIERVGKGGDELHAVLLAALQTKYMLQGSALLEESLYSCTRSNVEHKERGEKTYVALSVKARRVAAVVECLHPYLKNKLDKLYKRWKLEEEEGNMGNAGSGGIGGSRGGLRERSYKQMFTFLYPFLHTTHSGIFFACE